MGNIPLKELKHILFKYNGSQNDKEYKIVENWLIDKEIEKIKNENYKK